MLESAGTGFASGDRCIRRLNTQKAQKAGRGELFNRKEHKEGRERSFKGSVGGMLAWARRAGRESDWFLGRLPRAALVGNELSLGYNLAVLQTAQSVDWGVLTSSPTIEEARERGDQPMARSGALAFTKTPGAFNATNHVWVTRFPRSSGSLQRTVREHLPCLLKAMPSA
jgi:hypothetical protein